MKSSFYRRFLRREEAADLEAAVIDNVLDEVLVLRVLFRRLLEEINVPPGQEDAPSRRELAYLLGMLGQVSNRIADLLMKQKNLGGSGDSISQAISQALAEVTKELNLS